MRAIRDEGMPTFRRPDIKGHLYIKFEIEFPKNSFLTYDELKVGVRCSHECCVGMDVLCRSCVWEDDNVSIIPLIQSHPVLFSNNSGVTL